MTESFQFFKCDTVDVHILKDCKTISHFFRKSNTCKSFDLCMVLLIGVWLEYLVFYLVGVGSILWFLRTFFCVGQYANQPKFNGLCN